MGQRLHEPGIELGEIFESLFFGQAPAGALEHEFLFEMKHRIVRQRLLAPRLQFRLNAKYLGDDFIQQRCAGEQQFAGVRRCKPASVLSVGEQSVVQRGIACAQAFEVEPVEALESRLRAQFREGKAVVQPRRGRGRSGLDMNGLCV